MLLVGLIAGCVWAAPTKADPVIAAAGDIACDSASSEPEACHQSGTSDLLLDPGLDAVLPLGDLQYQSGGLTDFNAYYAPTWGRVAQITRPTPGNHDYGTPEAAGYFAYFNNPPAYYSYEVGSWHLISLNSEVDHESGSAQLAWLRADLADHPSNCALAYWHKPRFSSGPHHSSASFEPFWQTLYEYGADVVLSGHDHVYERFAPQGPNGVADPVHGIRQFVVGTGGKSHYAFGPLEPNSEVRNSDTFGVLKLTLHDASYDWIFEPEVGAQFRDSGSASCSIGQPGQPPPDRFRPGFRTPLRSSPPLTRAAPGAGVTLDTDPEATSAVSPGANDVLRRLSRVLRAAASGYEQALASAVRSPSKRHATLNRAEDRLRRVLRRVRRRVDASATWDRGGARTRLRLLRSLALYARAIATARQGLALGRERRSAATRKFRRALRLVRQGERLSRPAPARAQ